MNNQPLINIGILGSVSHGKSSLVHALTGIRTQRHASEKERNITIRLGYTNLKIWKCSTCPDPECYDSSDSSKQTLLCRLCGESMILVNHLSLVDCPGHSMLTGTMMSGSCLMDYTCVIESCTGEQMPAPQTIEHLKATRLANIPNKLVCMNKIDLVKRDKALSQINLLNSWLWENHEIKTNIIPISASLGANIDIVCKILAGIPVPPRITDTHMQMVCIRSFDVNKPGTSVIDLVGGVLGGTIIRGSIQVGDWIVVYPGICISENNYRPIRTQVMSIHSDQTSLKSALPGGLMGIQTTLDPAHTKNDQMVGSLIVSEQMPEQDIMIYREITLNMIDIFIDNPKQILAKDNVIQINFNANNIPAKIMSYKKNMLTIELKKPIAMLRDTKNIITIMLDNRIIGRGMK